METKTIRQSVTLKVSPHEIYEAIMDSKKHAKFSGSHARIVPKVGGEFSAYDGYNHGKILELVPDKKIVIALRHDEAEWPENHFSKATFEFKKTKVGTLLDFTQSGVPVQYFEDISQGWKDFYWEPLMTMLQRE